MSFERAFDMVIGHEGGFVDDPRDPGGATKFGISQRQYPLEDIPNLTLDRAKAIYQRDYWQAIRGDELPPAVGLCMFDFGVNSGVTQAIRTLQKVLDVPVDGDIGPVTLTALKAHGARQLVVDIQAERLLFLTRLTTFDTFGRGWTRRAIDTAIEACS